MKKPPDKKSRDDRNASRSRNISSAERKRILNVEKTAQIYVDHPSKKNLNKLTKAVITYTLAAASTSISNQGMDASYSLATLLPTIMDSGSQQHIARAVENAVNAHIKLIGIGGHKNISTKGTLGTLMDVLQVVDTPANLISSGKLLEHPKWKKFVIEKDATNPVNQTWYGITYDDRKITLAYRNADTDLLYYATMNTGHKQNKSFPAFKSRRKTNDRQEQSKVKWISQSMGAPLPKVLKKLRKHFKGLKVKTQAIKDLERTTKEQHLLGSQTNPRRYRLTKEEAENKKLERGRLEFFESLTADSFDLTYEDYNKCKKGYLICDRKTGTAWCFLYKKDSQLYDVLLEFLVNEAARWKIILAKPGLKCVRIKMDGLSVQQSTKMRTALAKLGIALSPVSPQTHTASGFIEVHIKKIKSIALKLWSGLGYKIPKRFFSSCFTTACQICDLLPDRSHPNERSSFEMRMNSLPTEEHMPRTLFSTVYFKNPDTDQKAGTSDTGIYIGPGRPGSNTMKIWVPRTGKILERRDPVFDESVSTYPHDRLQRMREGETVHTIHDKEVTTPRTRQSARMLQAEMKTMSQVSRKDGSDWINLQYKVVTQGKEPLKKPFECGCCNKRYVSVHKIKAHANKMFLERDKEHTKWMKNSSGPSKKIKEKLRNNDTLQRNKQSSSASIHAMNAPKEAVVARQADPHQSTAKVKTTNATHGEETRLIPSRKRKRSRKKKKNVPKNGQQCNTRVMRSQIKRLRNGRSFATFRTLMIGKKQGKHHIPDLHRHVAVEWSTLGQQGGVETRHGIVTRSGRIWFNVKYSDGSVTVHDRDNVWTYTKKSVMSMMNKGQKKRQRSTTSAEPPHVEHRWISEAQKTRIAMPTMEDSIPSNVKLRVSQLASDAPTVDQKQRRSYLAAHSLSMRRLSSRYEQPVPALSSKRHRKLQQSFSKKRKRGMHVQPQYPQGDSDMHPQEAWLFNANVAKNPSHPSDVENARVEEEEYKRIQQLYDDIQFRHDPAPQLLPGAPDVTLRSLYATWFEEQPLSARATLPTPEEEDLTSVREHVQHYHGPEGCEESATEIHGYHANLTQTEYHPVHGYVILTPENASREEPNSMKEARESKHWDHGLKAAVEAEIACMNTYKVFTRDRLPKGRKCIGVRWVFKAKFENGKFVKWKARMCAQGFSLLPGLEYKMGETSSPVARSHTYMAALAEAAQMGYKLKFFDIKSAYLLSQVNERLYMKIPEGVELGLDEKTNTNCLRICRSIYGLPQSGRNHYVRFTGQLLELGFEQSKNDPCLFTLRKDGEILRLVLWVDDAVITTSSEELWVFVRDAIHSVSPLGKEGNLEWVLGMQVEQDLEAGTISLNQTSKIQMIIERYGSPNAKPKTTPLPPNGRR